MKRIFQLLVFSVMALQFNLHSQSPIVQQIVDSANQDSLMYFVKELSGNVPTIINGALQTIVSRNKYQPGNALAETYIKQKLQYYGLTTSIQSFSSTGKNVLGVQVGSEFPNQKYIICAHYDDMPTGTTAPGADDNASGTSAVLEAARIFSQHTFPFTIIYALWDEEEQGLVGSNYYANQAASAGDSIIGVINMDMIAYDSDNDMAANIHTRSVGTSLELYDKMIEANYQYGINLNLIEYNPGSEYSDHASFWNAGYGAILLIEDDADFNAYYHTVNDLITHFNQEYYLKSAKLAYATLASFALNLNMQIIHTPFASIDYSQDIELTASIVTGLNIGSGISGPRLYYRTSTGGGFSNFIEVAGTPVMSNTEYSFVIPAQQLGTIVQYYLAAQDDNSSIVVTLPAGGGGFNPPGNIPPPHAFQFYVAPVTFALVDSANNTNNWQSTGGWNITSQKFVSAPYSFTESPSEIIKATQLLSLLI
ncbi:MAG: M28 family peptidase [Ignavibacteriales bacterium]|nr:M28 family peptidase [Ignavibacteriales bacterium]